MKNKLFSIITKVQILLLMFIFLVCGVFAANIPAPTVGSITNQVNALITPNPSGLDAFQKYPVSQGRTLWDYIPNHGLGLDAYEWINSNANTSVTWLTNQSTLSFQNWSNGVSRTAYQSRSWNAYIPGKGFRCLQTASIPFTSTSANMIIRWGPFSDDNGLFWICSNGVMGVGIRSKTSGSVVETITYQNQWNVDNMLGGNSVASTNASGLTLNPQIGNIYGILAQWLGYGKVQFIVNYGGQNIIVHYFDHSGSNAVYTGTMTQPIRWEVQNIGSITGTNGINLTCATVISDGADDYDTLRRPTFYYQNQRGVSGITTGGECVIAIRQKQVYNGITNRVVITPLFYQLKSSTPASVGSSGVIQYSPTLSAGTWFSPPSIGGFSSGAEICTNCTLITPGVYIDGTFLNNAANSGVGASINTANNSAELHRYPISNDNSGTNQTQVIGIIMFSDTGSITGYGGIQWSEAW